MKVALVAALPDPTRWSMQLYHDRLREEMRPLLRPGEELISLPAAPERWKADLSSAPGKLRRYFQQYVFYGPNIRAANADVYHILDHGYCNLLPFLKEKKTVVCFHDALLPRLAAGDLPVWNFRQTSVWAQRYCLSLLPRADAVVTPTEFSRREMLEFCPGMDADKTGVVPMGVETVFEKKFSQPEIDEFRRKHNLKGKVLLMAGRTDAHKNTEGTLRVAAKLARKMPDGITLLKTGSDLTPDQKERMKKLEIESFFRFIGSVESSRLPLVYQASDLLLHLSFYEGFGFPVLEAMKSGVPAVVAACGSLPEVAGGAALQVDPLDEEGAAEACRRMLTDVKLRESFIDKGRERASSFSWARTARETLEIYRKLHA